MKDKPDYMLIMSKSCKQFVAVVRRLIEHEGLKHFRSVHHIEKGNVFDVVLNSGPNVWIIRHFRGTTKAAFGGFPVRMYGMITNEEKPDINHFLNTYDTKVRKIDRELWFPNN